MAEGYTASGGKAWGCTNAGGWVPYPKEIPRRHAFIDSVGRIDDPCDHPLKQLPNYEPVPKFKPPREGYPNNMCRLEDYQQDRADEETGGGCATINLASGTPKSISLRVQAIDPSQPRCADPYANDDSEPPEVVRFADFEPPQIKNDIMGKPCNPRLRPYPCTAVIPGEIPPFEDIPEEKKCPPQGLPYPWLSRPYDLCEGAEEPTNGWEGIEGKRTCDHYPIDEYLPSRFNNADWFKGYGCERPVHPFYMTTTSNYGRFGPTPHTMPLRYNPKQCGFTDLLGRTGMYRNRTLNTNSHKTKV